MNNRYAYKKKNNSGNNGVKYLKRERAQSRFKVQTNGHMQTSLATLEEHDRTDTLASVGDSQLSYSTDTKSESNSSSTYCSSSSSTKIVSLLDRLYQSTYIHILMVLV